MGKMDLHMHSSFSPDGEFSPEELVELCHKAGLEIIAVTDHNSVRGIRPAVEAAQKYGIRVLPGIEIDCTLDGVNLHLLGYGVDAGDPAFVRLEQDVQRQEIQAGQQMMKAAHEMGWHFADEACLRLARNGVVTGEIIAEAALADERNADNVQLNPYRPGGSRSENPLVNVYWDFFSQGKTGHAPVQYISFEEARQMIVDSGGFSVLAHPAITVGRDEARINRMIRAGIAGIEVYSSYHTREDREYYERLADAHGLLKTVGSDFHGKTKPSVQLGLDGGDYPQLPMSFFK